MRLGKRCCAAILQVVLSSDFYITVGRHACGCRHMCKGRGAFWLKKVAVGAGCCIRRKCRLVASRRAKVLCCLKFVLHQIEMMWRIGLVRMPSCELQVRLARSTWCAGSSWQTLLSCHCSLMLLSACGDVGGAAEWRLIPKKIISCVVLVHCGSEAKGSLQHSQTSVRREQTGQFFFKSLKSPRTNFARTFSIGKVQAPVPVLGLNP